ncbi:MAG: FG-GAP-like repeat-containing protein [Verrucomicrobia bacterium]|nr:FG-GAP-like repeat-containing protein [Verrucomicrobiota bacterium]
MWQSIGNLKMSDLAWVCGICAMAMLLAGCGDPKMENSSTQESSGDQASALVQKGRNLYQSGKPLEAAAIFLEASALSPTDPGLKLNIANAWLAAGDLPKARASIESTLELDPGSAAAHYLLGLVHMKEQNPWEALKAFQTSELIEPNSSDFSRLNNLTFQIGRAHMALQQWDQAIEKLYDLSTFDENHPAVWYNLGQALLRVDRQDEASEALDRHQQILALRGTSQTPERELEICRHTEIYAPFVIEKPSQSGIPISFENATVDYLGSGTNRYSGPLGVLDFNHTGTNSLWVIDAGKAFRLLSNTGGSLQPTAQTYPIQDGDSILQILTGDIQNSGFEDVLALGQKTTYAFNLMTNGVAREQSRFAGLAEFPGSHGWFADINYTGHIDLILKTGNLNTHSGTNLLTLENIGNFYFYDVTSTSSIPAHIPGLKDLVFEDWNQDDMLDMVVATDHSPVTLWIRQRGAGFLLSTNVPTFPTADAIATADFDNDLRPDLVFAGSQGLQIHIRAQQELVTLTNAQSSISKIIISDLDNDGWKDILTAGESISLWRNLGQGQFDNVTGRTQLSNWHSGSIRNVHPADMDQDGDTDLVVDTFQSGIQILRNQGGNQNRQIKIRLDGTRSNRSGLGIQIEMTAGNWRTLHTVHSVPIEIGVGQRNIIDSMSIRWSDAADGELDIGFDPKKPWVMTELRIATGSCPYLYVWDGESHRFVTDLLGASPLGLPAARGFLIPADPMEFVELGDDSQVRPRDGFYQLQVTEELREILYLDEARLVVMDHPENVEIFATSKLVSGPSPGHKLLAVRAGKNLESAVRSDGRNVTRAAEKVDGIMISPVKLRDPQYRGLAEPWSVELNFDKVTPMKSPILVLNGWLQFGGGMANIAGSLRKDFPFPFPQLEFQDASSTWHPVDVEVGAPAGKTKTIVVDLTGKIPEGTTRLRLSTGFEIHWDRISLMELAEDAIRMRQDIHPTSAHLHWRGFSAMDRDSQSHPLSPDYGRVAQKPQWTHTPAGWCTAYGEVMELVQKMDDQLVVMNGGDELTLSFPESALQPKSHGSRRSFFYFNVGWDKDADFHVVTGSSVDPIPWHGMDYQKYGSEPLPADKSRAWIQRWNTRWVPGLIFERNISSSER